MLALALGVILVLVPSSSRADEGDGANLQTISVKPGDTLWSIANAYLKDPQRWNELLRYNKQLNSDPTIALPGMALKVPAVLVKPALRAASLSYVENEILYRARGKTEWVRAKLHMPLYADDQLKTGSMSRARIKFPLGSVLNLDANSIVVIKPEADPQGVDLKLLRGRLRALHISLKADDTVVAPKTEDTIYEAAIKEDGSAKVEVYSGDADVLANGLNVGVKRGFFVDVPAGRAPAPPKKMIESEMPEEKVAAVHRINTEDKPPSSVKTDLGHFDVDFQSLPLGSSLAGFRVQASKTRDFKETVFDRNYEIDEEINFHNVGLPSGSYWWRVAPVDLLGAPGKFSEPKQKSL